MSYTTPALDAPHTVDLLDLPLEILEGVFYYLDDPEDSYPARTYWRQCYQPRTIQGRRRTVQNARLVCRIFNQLASRVLFSAIEIDVSESSLDFIDRVSSRPLLAKSVRHISLYLYYRPALDLQVFAASRARKLADIHECIEQYDATQTYHNAIDAWDILLTGRNDDLLPPHYFSYHQCLVQGYENYRQLHDEQFRLIAQKTFVTRLATALKRLPLSCSLTFTDSTDDYPQPWSLNKTSALSSTENLCQYLTTPYTWREIESFDRDLPLVPAKILTDLPMAIKNAGVLLSQLNVLCSPTTKDFHLLWHKDLYSLPWDNRRDSFENLQVFSYAPCLDLTNAAPRSETIRLEEREFVDQYISAGLSSRCLWSIELNLCGLGIVEVVDDENHITNYYPLGPALSNTSWPCLRSLKMSYISLKQTELDRLSLELGPYLEEFYIEGVGLAEGVWHDAVDILREKLNTRFAQGECSVSLRSLKGGEFERDDVKLIDSMSDRWLHDSEWGFNEEDTVVAQLVSRYVNDATMKVNPFDTRANITQILLGGPPKGREMMMH